MMCPRASGLAAAALLSIACTQAYGQLNPLTSFGTDGYLVTGDRTYLTADHSQRGLAYNDLTNNLYVVDRDASNVRSGLAVHALDSTTGAHLNSFNVTGVTGGHADTFPGNLIRVADDGAIYLTNLAVNSGSTNFRIWRWANEAAALTSPPTLVYEGNPRGSGDIRIGDSFDIRGSGADTQMIFGLRHTPEPGDNRAVVFETTDGTNFTPQLITNTDAGAGAFYIGTAWGNGNEFYGNTGGGTNPVFHMSYDPATGAATVLGTNAKDGTGSFTSPSMNAIEYDPETNAMVGIVTGNMTTHDVQYYALNNFNDAQLLDDDRLPNAGPEGGYTNGNGSGSIAFGEDGRVYALVTNVGIAAYVVPEPSSLSLLVLPAAALLRRRRA